MGHKDIQIIAVANQKGGVGKTTTALTLGASFCRLGYRTLVLDLDPHASATIHLAYYPEQTERTIQDIFLRQEEPAALWGSIIQRDERHHFDFVPGSIHLSDLEAEFKNTPGKGILLKQSMETLRERYDFIILDCPPQLGVILINALVAADLTIIPIQTEFLALHGLRLTFDTIRMLNKAMPEPIFYRALATMYDRRLSACKRVYNMLRKRLGDRFFSTVIHIDTKFREASAKGKVIFDVDPESRGSKEFVRLAKEIVAL
jgi:chromosome partitioning protein